MSTCPTDDIHSIYLDGELPLAYMKEYEAHVASCPKCAKKLESLGKVHEILKADSKSMELDEVFMDESFSRLSTKLRYSKNSGAANVHKFPDMKIVSWGVAVAAVVAAVIIPFRIGKTVEGRQSQQVTSDVALSPVVRPQNVNGLAHNVVVNGNISDQYAHNVSTGSLNRTYPAGDVDIFRPEFSGSNNITFNFDMAGFEQNEINVRIRLPEKTISGQLQ